MNPVRKMLIDNMTTDECADRLAVVESIVGIERPKICREITLTTFAGLTREETDVVLRRLFKKLETYVDSRQELSRLRKQNNGSTTKTDLQRTLSEVQPSEEAGGRDPEDLAADQGSIGRHGTGHSSGTSAQVTRKDGDQPSSDR